MNIQSILTELGIRYEEAGHHHVRTGWIGMDCCDCSPNSGRFLLGVSLEHGNASCWQCGPKRLVDVLMSYTGLHPSKVVELLRGVGWDRIKQTEAIKGKLKIPEDVGPLEHCHRKYLRRRGFDPDRIASLWGVYGIGLDPRYGWRLFIPITKDGQMVSWTTRAIGDRVSKRYDNAPKACEAVPAKSILYGDDLARHAIVITEGPIDCWAIGPGAVSVMGLAYSRSQLLAMSQHPVRVVCFDSEPAARRRAYRLADELKPFPGETYVVELETGKDAAEADRKEIETIRRMFLEW